MTIPSELEAFQARIRSVPEVEGLLDEIAQEASVQEMTAAERADPGTVALSLVAVAALWKLLGTGIEALRSMSRDAAIKRRIGLIDQLQHLGYGRQAPLILDRLQKELRERPEDDPVLKALIKLSQG
jgi:hypothetical protein